MSFTSQPIIYTKLESHLSAYYPCHVSNSAVTALIKMDLFNKQAVPFGIPKVILRLKLHMQFFINSSTQLSS